MAPLAFAVELVAVVATIIALVWQIRDLQGLTIPLRADRDRPRPVAALSVVLLVEPGSASAEQSVASILDQDHPALEVVVVSAPTGSRRGGQPSRPPRPLELPDDPRLKVVELDGVPAGWMRRPYAFHRGFEETSNAGVLFLDESLLLRESALLRAVDTATWVSADLLTLLPEITATTWLERLMMPFLLQLTLLVRSLPSAAGGELDAFLGYGPFQLFRPAAYEAVGGHAGVRGELFEDMALARRVQAAGRKLVVCHGVELAVVQGQTSLAAIWRAWARAFNRMTADSLPRALGAAGLVLVVFALPWLLLAVAPLALLASSTPAALSPWTAVLLLGAANVLVAFAHRRVLRDTLRVDDSLLWLQPLAALLTAAMLMGSTFHLEGGRLAPWAAHAAGLVRRS